MLKEIVVAARISEELNNKLLNVCSIEERSPSYIIGKAIELYVNTTLSPDGLSVAAAKLPLSTPRNRDIAARMNKSIGPKNYELYPEDELGKLLLSLAGKKRFGSHKDLEKWEYIIGVFGVELTPDHIRKLYSYWRRDRKMSKYAAVKCILNQLYKSAQEEEDTEDVGGHGRVSDKEQSLMAVRGMYKRLGFDVEEMDKYLESAVEDRERELKQMAEEVEGRKSVEDIRDVHRQEMLNMLSDALDGVELFSDVVTTLSTYMALPEAYVAERLKELARSGCLEIDGDYVCNSYQGG